MLYLISFIASLIAGQSCAADMSGDYAGNCTGDIQCSIEISAGRQVAVTVADHLDFSKKRCVVSGTLAVSDHGLAGDLKPGMKVFINATPDGGIYVNGLANQACGLNLNGYYGAIGD